VSRTGVVSARLGAVYDLLLSQKLIAQPFHPHTPTNTTGIGIGRLSARTLIVS
jgi:uncharacterized protein involved in copper resistance